jgi:hypothetical protein
MGETHVEQLPALYTLRHVLSRVYNSLPQKRNLYTMGLHAGQFISGVRK